MALPDIIVRVLGAVTPRPIPTNTAIAFTVGVATRGWEKKPRLLKSMSDFINAGGARLTTSPLYDWMETFFAEGGTEVWWQRVFGAGAVTAKVELKEGGTTSLIVEAGSLGEKEPGVWGNALKVAVVAVTGGYALQVSNAAGLIEESPKLVTREDAIAWANTNSLNIRITLGANVNPPSVAVAAALTGGTDGAAVADADYALAWPLLSKDLGPGQSCSGGQTTEVRHLQVIANAVSTNRFALLDGPDTHTVATLVALAQALYLAPSSGRRYAQLFAPWEVIPGLTPTTTRTVPPSARAAAMYARIDSKGNPNIAAAAANGEATFVLDLSQTAWTDAERLELNNAGVTCARRRFGNRIVTWGVRNLADQVNEESWSFAANIRCIMAFVAQAEVIGEAYEAGQIDGFGQALGQLNSDLKALASRFLLKGALYGKTPQEAFYVNTSESLNPPKAVQEGKMQAQVGLKVSPSAEQVIISIVKTPITTDFPQ